MELSLFLAKAWGLYAIISSLALLIKKQSDLTKLLKDFNNEVAIVLSGLIAVGLGITSVLGHNVWVADWRVFVTIFGWLALLKGISLLFVSQKAFNLSQGLIKSSLLRVILIIYLLVGVYLAYTGFYS